MTEKYYKYDVIMSYHHSDNSTAQEISKGLREAGLSVWCNELPVRLKGNIKNHNSDAFANSRALLSLISENSLSSSWNQMESETLRFRNPENKERFFIPIRLDSSPIPDNLRHLFHLEWKAEDSTEIIARLAAVCHPPEGKPTYRGVLIDRVSPKKYHKIKISSHVHIFELDQKSRLAACGTSNGEIFIIDIKKPAEPAIKLSGHNSTILGVDFHPTNNWLLSSSRDNTVRLWDLHSGLCLKKISGNPSTSVIVKFIGDSLGVFGQDNSILVLNDFSGSVTRELRGHEGHVYSLQVSGNTLVSASADQTIRVWNTRTDQCTRVLEGHVGPVRCIAINSSGTLLLSGSDDCTIRLWDLRSGVCLNSYDAHTDKVLHIAWHPEEKSFVSAGGDRTPRLWEVETGKLLRILDGNNRDICGFSFVEDSLFSGNADHIIEWGLKAAIPVRLESDVSEIASNAEAQVQYTNAKVLLVGDSGAGKTGLSKRLANEQWEASAASTVGAWATQWSLPAIAGDNGDREIWLWDFGGQADQRLIHQLYMDDTALAILVFDAQKANVFESLIQWERDLTRSTDKPFAKLLVAGRVDASPVRVSRQDIDQYVKDYGFVRYCETSALTNRGCDELRDAIVNGINWDNIPWRSSPVLFKLLKEQIVQLKDEGRVLMRFNELRDALRLRLPENKINFVDAELKAVLSLLSGPGVVLELEFGAWILFQPELINAYSQAVIATMRDDPSELGCISEQKVLEGDLVYGSFKRLPPEDERFVLLEMHRKLLQRGLCARELTDKDVLLVFPSYYKRNRPELVGHPAILVSYRFDGVVDEVYSTLVVRLNHTHEFKRDQLWQDAAEFTTKAGAKIGVKLSRRVASAAASIEVYCDSDTLLGEKIIFVKYIHDHLLQRAARVIRRRHYVCSECSNPIADLEAAEKRRNDGKLDIGCQMCDARVKLNDDLEALYTSAEYQLKVQQLEGLADKGLDNESKERILVGEVMSRVAHSGHISREMTVSDHGIDMEIEFKNNDGQASGQRLYLQLKSGNSYIRTNSNGKEIFTIKNERHAQYWASQIAPVMLVIRTSNGDIRWMEIRDYLRQKMKAKNPVRKIEFKGERLDLESILKWRNALLANQINLNNN